VSYRLAVESGPDAWLPLAGRRILELAGGVSARYCGHLLARLGAEVLRVRGHDADDDELGYGGASGRTYGRWLDQRKVELDPADVPFVEVDAVVAGLDERGIAAGLDAMAQLPGDPLLLVISWFGSKGAYCGWRGSDELIHALTGIAYSFGPSEGPPTIPQGHAPQVMAGAQGANLILAGLLADSDTRPRRIDVDVLETALCLSEVGAVAAIDDPSQRSMRLGVNRFSPTYPCSSYRSADGWIGLTCLTPAQWQALCGLIDRPDLAREPAYRTSFRRLLRGDEIDSELAPAIATRTTEEWVAAGIAHRIPIAPMPRPSELPDQPHWRDRGSFAPASDDDRDIGVVAPTLPFAARSDGSPRLARPRVASSPGPLSGVRILDFTMGWAGPQATRFLADLGADVVKVESATHPDWYRGWEADLGGDPPPTELRSSFNTLNRNKRGVTLDLDTPEGRSQAERLIVGADVVIENFAAGVLDRLGLSQAVQRRLAPGLVSLSMPAFGNGGPLTGVRAYGSTVEQASGLPFVNGVDGWSPSLQHVAYGDAVAGIFAVTATLAGLHAQRTSGGADLDLSQVACLFELGADAIIAEQQLGRPLPRTGSQRGRLARCEVLACRDEDTWVVVAADSTEALPRDLSAWARDRDPHQAAAELQAEGIRAAPVVAVHQLGTDPHLVASGFWTTMQRRYVGRHALGAPPFHLDGHRPAPRHPAPTLGEHTEEIAAAADPWITAS
jgi:crotonobetainyl-CoA:carnitine CoA-transferase CaiB-like acyl-CoA transferase